MDEQKDRITLLDRYLDSPRVSISDAEEEEELKITRGAEACAGNPVPLGACPQVFFRAPSNGEPSSVTNDYLRIAYRLEQQNADAATWSNYMLIQVAIASIERKATWSPEKEALSLHWLSRWGCMPPVHLKRDAEQPNLFRIIDGIHRIAAASEIGDEFVPAVMHNEWTSPSLFALTAEQRGEITAEDAQRARGWQRGVNCKPAQE